MIQSQPIARVVEILTGAGYRCLTAPIMVASVPFEFAALLVGADRANDLVVIIDTLVDSEERIRQKVEGLSRALDFVASRRSLTVVLVGPTPRTAIIESLSRVSRVLPVGTPVGKYADRSLADALAVLLPLNLPDANATVTDPLKEIRRALPASTDEHTLATLLAAAASGTDAVKETLRESLEALLDLDSEDIAP